MNFRYDDIKVMGHGSIKFRDLKDVNLSDNELKPVKLDEALMNHYNSVLSGKKNLLSISNKDLSNLNFSSRNLQSASFENCTFSNVFFTHADLSTASFAHCTFHNVCFSYTHMRRVHIEDCNFDGCTFTGTFLVLGSTPTVCSIPPWKIGRTNPFIF